MIYGYTWLQFSSWVHHSGQASSCKGRLFSPQLYGGVMGFEVFDDDVEEGILTLVAFHGVSRIRHGST